MLAKLDDRWQLALVGGCMEQHQMIKAIVASVIRFSGDTEDFIVDSLEKLLYVIENDV